VTINFRCIGNGNGETNYSGQISTITNRSGTGIGDMTIQWDWDQWTEVQPFDVDGLVGGSTYSTYSDASGAHYSRKYESGRWVERGKRQTLTISNITQDMVLNITIRNGGWSGTNNNLIYQPTFAGVTTNSTLSTRKSLRRALAAPSTPQRSASTTTDPVLAYLNTAPDTASCKDGENHTYKEIAGTFTIKASDSWKLRIPDLPKYNEYGKPYTYYVVETPVTGYDTTYTGQDNGVKESGTIGIINTRKTVNLSVNKTWVFANPSRVAQVDAEGGNKWPQGVTVHVVVYSKTGENDPVPTSYEADLTAANPSHTFTLPEYIGENKAEYSIVEAGVTGLDSTNFTTEISGSAESGYTITNTEKPSTKEFSFTKFWRVAVGETKISWKENRSRLRSNRTAQIMPVTQSRAKILLRGQGLLFLRMEILKAPKRNLLSLPRMHLPDMFSS